MSRTVPVPCLLQPLTFQVREKGEARQPRKDPAAYRRSLQNRLPLIRRRCMDKESTVSALPGDLAAADSAREGVTPDGALYL
jgi:hypothetical protein